MRPQRKPFVVEIRKAKQVCRKPAPAGANRTDPAVRTGVGATVSLAVQSEGRV